MHSLALVLVALAPATGWSNEEPPSTVVDETPGLADGVAETPAVAPEAIEEEVPDVPPMAWELYEEGRQALNVGDRDRARTLLRRLRRDHLGSWHTAALASLLGQPRPAERLLDRAENLELGHNRVRYSRKTLERRKVSGWETADFIVTALAYGLGVGGAYAVGFDADDAFAAPIVLGGVLYGSLSAPLLAHADRGDLPLALGIAAYVPTTALFAGMAADADPEAIGLAVGLTGTLALPAAGLAAAYTDLDPGDTQLIRDAGFWGLVLGLSGTTGFSCLNSTYYCSVEQSTLGLAGLLGLYGGLGVGALVAAYTEVSLERVRLTTLVGYVGGIAGALVGSSTAGDEDIGLGRGVALGSVVGLLIGSLATLPLDRVPDNASLVLVPAVGRDGEPIPTVGLGFAL